MRMLSLFFLNLISLNIVCFANLALADSPFTNLSEIKKALNFDDYYSEKPRKTLKVAILDKGFYGYEAALGKTIPKRTVYHAGPLPAPQEIKVEHGLAMAQIFTAFVSNDWDAKQFIPELHLYNVYGFTNFKSAIDEVIKNKFDIVLYSEVWELGGNGDGRGFINAEVSRATKAGVLWVNAAGNFHKRTYRGPIKVADEDWVRLPDQNKSLSFTCEKNEKNKSGKCQVRVVLTWNDFKNDPQLGTKKDLDLALTDDLLNIVQSSALIQSDDKNEERPGYSKYPRESIQVEVKPGTYFIRVKAKSTNFTSKDQLRITIDGDPIVSKSAKAEETLLNPADNPGVITVGATDSERSSRSPEMGKPEFWAPSSIKTEKKEEYRGSSNSAAIVAAGISIYKSMNPSADKSDLLEALATQERQEEEVERGPSDLSLADLAFMPTGPRGCFEERPGSSSLAAHVTRLLRRGGKLVNTNYGYRVMVDFDPIVLAEDLERNMPNDMILATPQGFQVANRFERIPFPAGSIEVFQIPADGILCSGSFDHHSSSPKKGIFRLPRL